MSSGLDLKKMQSFGFWAVCGDSCHKKDRFCHF